MTDPRPIRAKLPDGTIGLAEGDVAPDLADAQLELDLLAAEMSPVMQPRFAAPLFAIHEVKAKEADELLVEWGHPLGGVSDRPFGYMAFVCEAFGRPVCVLVSASTPNKSVSTAHGLHRYNTVELARIARPDEDRQAMLACARLWTTYLAPMWPERYGRKWAGLDAAVTYSLPGTPSAKSEEVGMYRRLGFKNLGKRLPGRPGKGSRQKVSKTDGIDDGEKRLWIWEYTRGVHVPIAERENPIVTIPVPPRGVDLRELVAARAA